LHTPNAIPTAEAAPEAAAAARATGWRAGWLVVALLGLLIAGLAVAHQMKQRRALAALWHVEAKLPFRPELIQQAGDVRVATDDERRLWLWQAGAPHELHRFNTKIAALAIDAPQQRIFAGDALGRLTIFQTATTSTPLVRQMPGRIVDLAVLDGGALAVCYGLSTSGPDYFITLLKEPLTDMPGAGVPLEFCTREIEPGIAGGVWFTTLNSRLGLLGAAGQPVATSVLEQRANRLIQRPSHEGGVYALDRRGGLASFTAGNKLAWRHQVSRDALTLGACNATGAVLLIADQPGTLYLVDGDGRTLAEWAHGDRPPLTAIFSKNKGFEIYHTDGTISALALDSVRAAFMLRDVWRVWGLCALALIIAGVGIVLSHRRLSAMFVKLTRAMFRARVAYFLLFPTLALLAVFCYWPALSALQYAFMQFSLSEPPHFIGLDNFRALGHDPYIWVGMRNLAILVVTGVLKTLTMPLLVAELVYWLMNDRLKHWMRTAFVLPTVVPGLVGIMLWKMIYQPEAGLLNETLRLLGFSQLARPWLGDEQLAIWAVVFAGFPWIGVFPFLIFLGGLINVPRDVFEAASVDGISVWQRFWKIDLPLIRPQVKLLLTFTFIGCIQDFTSVLVFTMGGPGNSTFVPALQMFLQTSQSTNLGYASAIGIFLFGLVILATGINFALMRTERE
jgi:ABC-type sugar transport system permease subunit